MTRSWGSIKFHAKANTKTRNILTGQGQIRQEAEAGGGVGRAVPHNSASIFAYAFIFGFSLSHAIDPWRPQNLPSFSFSLLLLTLLSLSITLFLLLLTPSPSLQLWNARNRYAGSRDKFLLATRWGHCGRGGTV